MPSTRDHTQEWLPLNPNRIERHYWKNLWRYRKFYAILAWRDIAVRYKQNFIGVAWALNRWCTMVRGYSDWPSGRTIPASCGTAVVTNCPCLRMIVWMTAVHG